LSHVFAAARADDRAAFIPYLTGGFPDQDGFLTHARTLLPYADVLEVGLPYSDPLGDGPTIQRSSEQALRQGATAARVFRAIETLRAETDKPIVMMTYYNPIYCHHSGEEGFLADLKAAGADGVILPDLPPDEADSLIPAARAIDLDTIFLVGLYLAYLLVIKWRYGVGWLLAGGIATASLSLRASANTRPDGPVRVRVSTRGEPPERNETIDNG
jgi:tryptophan synthase alpha chain